MLPENASCNQTDHPADNPVAKGYFLPSLGRPEGSFFVLGMGPSEMPLPATDPGGWGEQSCLLHGQPGATGRGFGGCGVAAGDQYTFLHLPEGAAPFPRLAHSDRIEQVTKQFLRQKAPLLTDFSDGLAGAEGLLSHFRGLVVAQMRDQRCGQC